MFHVDAMKEFYDTVLMKNKQTSTQTQLKGRRRNKEYTHEEAVEYTKAFISSYKQRYYAVAYYVYKSLREGLPNAAIITVNTHSIDKGLPALPEELFQEQRANSVYNGSSDSCGFWAGSPLGYGSHSLNKYK